MKKSPLDFVKSWSTEFDATSNRVRQLIGDEHWLSDGKHKEAILRNFLNKYTYNQYVMSSGFIASSQIDSASSGEIDLLVVSPSKGIPWFYDSGILITPPEPVVAHIHVKSGYKKNQLMSIFKSSERANLCISQGGSYTGINNSVWSAGFFFDNTGSFSLTSLGDNIKEGIENIGVTSNLMNAVFIHPHVSVIINKKNKEHALVNIIKSENIVPALFLSSFYEFMNIGGSTEIGDLLFNQMSDESTNFTVRLAKEKGNG